MEYLSKECFEVIHDELKRLVEVEFPKAKSELVEAREKGDLSENFEYHAAKRAQGKLLSRIRYLSNILENARVLDTENLDCNIVRLLRRVDLTNLATNAQMSYSIVNPHESNLREGKISIKSPIAEALLGKRVGDVVEVHVPAGLLRLRIDAISV